MPVDRRFVELLEEILNEEAVPESTTDLSAAEREAEGFDRKREKEQLAGATQDREQRKIYASRIFCLVAIWLATIILLVVLQGFLGPRECFALSDSVLIAVATTTTASVTALLVFVARYLFREQA